MRTIVNQSYRNGTVTVVCDDGTFWIGQIRKVEHKENSEDERLIVEWKPLNAPPDGDPFVDKRGMFDKLKDKILDEAE